MHKRNVLHSPRLSELKSKRRRNILKKIFLVVFVLGIILFCLVYLSKLNRLNISNIEIAGNTVVDTEALKKAMQEQIAGKYLWLFPKTNILFYPQSTIKSIVQDKFKRIKGLELSIENSQTLLLTIEERIAEYTWCGTLAPESNNNQKCYFLDSEGYIFDEAPYFSPGVYFKFYGDSSINTETPSGNYFLKNDFARIIVFKNRLIEFNIYPASFWLSPEGDASFYLSVKSPAPYIIFKLDSDLEKVAENLHAALSTEPLKTKFKTKFSSLEYIDLRFGNKVYDKFR